MIAGTSNRWRLFAILGLCLGLTVGCGQPKEILNVSYDPTRELWKDINEIFRQAQSAFNVWSTLPPEERTAAAILSSLSFDFFELLDSVTIARSRKHIETFYDTKDIGKFPERRKPLSFHCPLTHRGDVMGFNDIFDQLSLLKLAVYAPVSYKTL